MRVNLAQAVFGCGVRGCSGTIVVNLESDGWYTLHLTPDTWHIELGVFDHTKTIVRCPEHCEWVVEEGELSHTGHWVDAEEGEDPPVELIYELPKEDEGIWPKQRTRQIEKWAKELRANPGLWCKWPFVLANRTAHTRASLIRLNKQKYFQTGRWEARTQLEDGKRVLYVRYLGV